jgi:hypothetical protein
MTRVRIPDHVVFRPFGRETVLLNLKTGQYHGLNRTGGRMLEVLADVGDTDVAAGTIAAEFSRPTDEVSRDMAELCAALAERSLVTIDGDGGSGTRTPPEAGAPSGG